MLTFTPLSGSARSSRSVPLAYLLQVDDVHILLDCGSPNWCPEPSSSSLTDDDIKDQAFHWEQYCERLRECVVLLLIYETMSDAPFWLSG